MKHGVLDEASLHVMHGLRRHGRWQSFMDVMHYVMYRLGKKDNGLQLFYCCLRDTQYKHPSFGETVMELDRAGSY